jgi:quercetin dioxygenase-like cupin family protein
MALSHAIPGQVLDVRPFGARLSGEKTVALFKSSDLEVMRLVLPAGKALPPHKVPGEITIHCLEGALNIELPHGSVKLAADELVFLAGGEVHGVTALADASALVTIALKP